MDVKDQRAYKDLEAVLEKHRKFKSNLVIVSVPGLGVSRLLREYAKKYEKMGVRYLTDLAGGWDKFNLIDLGGQVKTEDIDKSLRSLDDEQKWAMVVLADRELRDSYVVGHAYEKYYFKAMNRADTAISARLIDEKISEKEIDKIYELSGGIAKISKFLTVNKGVEWDNVDLGVMAQETLKVTLGVEEEILGKMGIKSGGKYVSQILEKLSRGSGAEGKINIKVSFDLTVEENGVAAKNKLTRDEKAVIEWMASNQGRITKEKIAELKWGEGKYDKFSDQAINKTMRRLGGKLEKYKIVTVPRVGYKIEVR